MGNQKSKIVQIKDLISESNGQQCVKISFPFTGFENILIFDLPSDYIGIMTNFIVLDNNFRKVELTLGSHIFVCYKDKNEWKMCEKIKIPLFMFNNAEMKLKIFPLINENKENIEDSEIKETREIKEIKVMYSVWSTQSNEKILSDGIKIYTDKNFIV